jgi:hypothetical protein
MPAGNRLLPRALIVATVRWLTVGRRACVAIPARDGPQAVPQKPKFSGGFRSLALRARFAVGGS